MIVFAKETISSHGIIYSLKRQLQKITTRYWDLEGEFTKLFMVANDFRDATQIALQRIKEVINEIFT